MVIIVVVLTTLWVQMPTLSLSSHSSKAIPTKSQSSWSITGSPSPQRHAVTTNDSLSTASAAESSLYLSLWPWEQDSIGSDRTCQTPIGIPKHCCLGSYGYSDYFQPNVCNLTRSVYERNEAMALSLLPPRLEHDIPHHDVECDACRLIDVLWENNWTMAFVGDSVTHQSFGAFECELHRRGIYNVQLKEIPFAITSNDSASDYTWQYGLRNIYELRVSNTSPEPASSSPKTTTIRMYNMYRPKLTDVQDYIAGRHDIIIFDHGLHYRADSAEFSSDMINLATQLHGDGKTGGDVLNDDNVELKLLAWRETSAQHFEGPSGDYHESHGSAKCVPLAFQAGVGDARSRAMEQVVQTLNWTKLDLVILPFREWTSHFHEMHIGGADCTHFCYAPSFWLYEWRQIRIAIENMLVRRP
jgi:hypothetical protein